MSPAATRNFLFPDMPTAVEAGQPGDAVKEWWAICASVSVIARLDTSANAALKTPATLAEPIRQGLEVIGGSPGALAEQTRRGVVARQELVQATGITAD